MFNFINDIKGVVIDRFCDRGTTVNDATFLYQENSFS